MDILKYIEDNWEHCIKNNMMDIDDLMGLPYPYTVPAVGHFDEIYYWDTYFTNKGLELCDRWQQVKNNTDDMLYLVDKYGFMPNGNRTRYLRNSQPPFLSIMVRDVYEHYNDKVWLIGAFETLLKEYDFWQTKRILPIELNCYGGDVSNEDEVTADYNYWKSRTSIETESTPFEIAMHTRAECESGWDFNPRWETDAFNYAPIDLNSLMYMFEKNMAWFSNILKNGQKGEWELRAEKRRKLMFKYMNIGNDILIDYNSDKNKHSSVFSAASFFPLFAEIATEKQAQALMENLSRIEAEYGILTCEKNDVIGSYQWDYPNGWACLQYIVIIGLDKYGYKEDAKRIAKKYTALVEKVFEETGNLWEKYNVVEGNINVINEYDMPQMMGWSAGVYLASKAYMNK